MNNQNSAKKIIEVDLSNKWPTGSVIVAKSMTGRYRSSALILSYLGNDTVSVSHASGRPTTMQTKTMQAKYRLATEAEASIFRDAAIGPDKDSAMGESKDAVPRGPRKVESAPAVEPEPQPTPAPAPAPAANDNTILQAIEKINESNRIANERLDSKFSAFVREQQAASNAFMERVLDRLAAPATQPALAKTREEEHDEATNKQVNEEMPWAKPQLWKFIGEAMEFVSFNSPAEIERALRPGEVFDQFSLWCEVNGLRVPFPKTVFRALLADDRTKRRWKISGKEEKTPLAIRRQTRFGFDESGPIGKDVQAIMDHARKTAWPALPESYRETIAKVLLDNVSKADVLTAISHIANMPKRGDSAYTPDKVLTAKHIRALVRIARAEGPAK